MSRQLLQDSLEVLKVAVPNLRREHMILAEKYAGTPYEQDPAYQKAEKAYKQASELQTRILAALAEPLGVSQRYSTEEAAVVLRALEDYSYNLRTELSQGAMIGDELEQSDLLKDRMKAAIKDAEEGF